MIGKRPLAALCLLTTGALFTTLSGSVSSFAQNLTSKKDLPKAGAQLWTLNYKKGDISRHRNKITLSGKMPNSQGDLNVIYQTVEKVEVRDISAKNEATLVHATESFEAIINGKPQSLGNVQLPPTTLVMSKSGLLIKQLDEDPQTANTQMAVIQGLLIHRPVPNGPVKTGDVWKTDLDNRLVPGKKVSLLSTFAGSEKLYGIDTLKVTFQLSVPTKEKAGESETIRAKGTYYLNPKNGDIARFDASVQNVEIPLPTGAVKGMIEVHNVLIVPGVTDKPAETAPK